MDDGAHMFPASYAQQRLWLVQQLDPANPFYLIPMYLRLRGRLDVEALHAALDGIVARHEALRTTFATVDGVPHQVVADRVAVVLPVIDVSHVDDPEQELARLESIRSRTPIDLSTGPIFRCALVIAGQDDHLLMIDVHHAACDAWSQDVLFRELATLYEGHVRGRPSPLPELAVQYPDFVVWQRELLRGDVLAEQVGHWRRQLDGASRLYTLAPDHPRPPAQSHRGEWYRRSLPLELRTALRAFAEREGVTLFMVTLAAFTAVLARVTGNPDVLVGSPIAGRDRHELEPLIGFFVNMLPLRVDTAGDPTFRELVHRAKDTCLAAYDHQRLPFDRLVEELDPERDVSHNPFFQIVFAVQNAPAEQVRIGDLALELSFDGDNGTAKFDLSVFLVERADGLACDVEYAADLFEADTIARLVEQYESLLVGAVATPDRPVSRLPLASAAQRAELLARGSGPAAGARVLLPAAVREWATRTPERIAVYTAEGELTYGELGDRASRLANLLRAWGVGPEVRVGVCLPRVEDLIVTLLAVLSAGGAYVPLDPAYPAPRLAAMIADAAPAMVLTTAGAAESFAGTDTRIVVVDEHAETIAAQSPEWPAAHGPGWEDAAYVLYTSGSTGVPKGTVVTHASLGNLLAWSRAILSEVELRGVLASSSVCFDASVWELWSPLALGGAMVLVDNVLGVAALPELVRERIGLLNTVPSALVELVRAGLLPATVHTVTAGGEPLPPATVRAVRDNGAKRVMNLYGPAEATVYATFHETDEEVAHDVVPMGLPLPNVAVYVLDRHLEPVPAGVVGELYIGGAGVARGYAGRPALTAARFVPDPHAGPDGARIYRTGDAVRWRRDGMVEYVGRTDNQVKVRGFRIELGDVESAMRAHPAVKDAAAAVVERNGTAVLVGYCAPGAAPVDEAAVRTHLANLLPAFMVPTRVVILPELPRTPSGKLDRGALPEPGHHGPEVTLDATPRDRTERMVHDIWKSVLGRTDIARNQNFFDIGGHSLLLLRVHDALTRALDRPIPVVDLFRHSTIAALAAHLRGTGVVRKVVEVTESRPADERPPANAVAVIGLDCRFPGARDPDEFWANLVGGVESVTTFSTADLVAAGLVPKAPGFVPRAGSIDDVADFDAAYFGYGPQEAELLDPQQRLLHECAATALDRAGYDSVRYPGLIGAYLGVGFNDYYWQCMSSAPERLAKVNQLLLQTATDKDFAATRLAYKLNLRGPALTVQSACSTSLAAAHLAYQAVVNGECDMALAGAANVRIPNVGYHYQHGGVSSPDGHTRPYGSDSGIVPGNGVGIVVLKRLADALADGDVVHAVLLGSGMSNDGSGRVGYTAPSMGGQVTAIGRALAQSGVDPTTIGMVEGHGAATELGDPIEVAALTEVYRKHGVTGTGGCALGSAKSNVGHLGVTAGIVGLIKTVLAVRHGLIPPTVNVSGTNPALELETTPFNVPTSPLQWPEGPRRAAVTSLGVGGTNVHMIIEQAPVVAQTAPGRPLQILPVSGRSTSAVERSGVALAEHLAQTSVELADVAHTLQVGRRQHAHRRAVVVADNADAVRALREPAPPGRVAEAGAAVVLVFGRSGVAPGRLRDLYWRFPVVREAVDAVSELVVGQLGADPRQEYLLSTELSGEWDTDPRRRAVIRRIGDYALGRLVIEVAQRVDQVIGGTDAELVTECLSGARPPGEILAPHDHGADARASLAANPPEPSDVVVTIGEDLGISGSVALGVGAGVIAERDVLGAVARMWEAGAEIWWDRLSGGPARRRVELPPYPFERTRYWVGDHAVATTSRSEDCFYQPAWQPSVGLARASGPAPEHLVVAQQDGVAVMLADRLRRDGSDVSVVADVASVDRLPARIVYFLPEVASTSTDAFDGVLALVRGLGRQPCELCVVSTYGQAVTGHEAVVPEHAMIAGLCLVVRQELPWVNCRLVDIEPAREPWRTANLADDLCAELSGGTEDRVAYRAGRRWVPDFVPARLAEGATPVVRAGGNYLIVGGLGRIGRVLAGHLVERYGAHVGLISRGGLPPRAEWDGLAENHPMAAKVARVRALEANGARVAFAAGDVGDVESFSAAVAAIEEELGPLHGVFHLADVIDEHVFAPLSEVDAGTSAAHFAAKVAGPNVMAAVFEDRELDFVHLGSSLSSVLGGIGFAGYAAANAYLDAFAHARNGLGPTRWTSVNWEGWWPEPTDTAESGALAGLGAAMTEHAIDDADGRRLLDRLLAGPLPPQVVVSTTPLAKRLEQHTVASPLPPAPPAPERHPRPPVRADYVAPAAGVESRLVEIWQRMLAVEPIGVRDDFFELGGDSLVAVQLVDEVRQEFGQVLRLGTVLEARTVAALAARLSAVESPVDRPLVPITTAGRQNLFIVHPMGGTVLCYEPLAGHLGADWSCYGLQSPALWEEIDPGTTVEKLADRYVSEIRSVQDAGPYHVAGWSAGGPIAFEIAQRLRSLGERVPTLAVMDAVAPGTADMSDVVTDAEIVLALAESTDLTAVPALPEGVHQGVTRRRIDRFVSWARGHDLAWAFTDLEHTARLYLVSRNVVDAWLRYRPSMFPGQLHVFRAEHRPAVGDWALGWRRYAESVQVHEVAGDHQSMFTEAEVDSLAVRLRSVLESASAVESS